MQAVHNSMCVCVCVCVCVRTCTHTEDLGHRLHTGQTHTCIFCKCTHTHSHSHTHTHIHTQAHTLSLSHTHTQMWDAIQVMGFLWKTYISATVSHKRSVKFTTMFVCFFSPPPLFCAFFCCCFVCKLFQQHQPTFLKALFSSLSLRALRDWERRFTEDFTTFFGASVTGSKTSSSSGSSSSSPKPAANAKLLTHRFILS